MFDSCNQNKAWQEIRIDGNVYAILVVKSDNVWRVLLTNLIEIWTETLMQECIAQRCQELNPLISIEEFDYSTTVTNLLNDITNHVAQASLHEIRLKSIVEDEIFKFSIKLTKGTPEDLWENVTKPLCLSSVEIMRRHGILIDLIKKKDEEIAEYKAEGAELIRKNIETKVFNEDQLRTHTPSSYSVACINAFQSIMEFYNSSDFHRPDEKKEPEITPTKKFSADRKRRDSDDNDDDPRRNHKSIQSPKSTKKATTDETITRYNERSPAVTPTKKLKTSLRDIII